MSTTPTLHNELRAHYEEESLRLQQDFSTTSDGLRYFREKTALIDSMAHRLWAQYVAAAGIDPSQIVFAAIGDFGRQTLFPFSEIDICVSGCQ
jgi:UTP:GlnB (protein PII) uridylyltransferase